MLLIFTIGFSGYSAAARAFCDESLHSPMMTQMADEIAEHEGMDMSDCPSHQDKQNKQKDADTDKTASKDKCMDCAHCCASHAMSISGYRLPFLPQTSVLALTSVDQRAGDFLFSLLRPPKSFV